MLKDEDNVELTRVQRKQRAKEKRQKKNQQQEQELLSWLHELLQLRQQVQQQQEQVQQLKKSLSSCGYQHLYPPPTWVLVMPGKQPLASTAPSAGMGGLVKVATG